MPETTDYHAESAAAKVLCRAGRGPGPHYCGLTCDRCEHPGSWGLHVPTVREALAAYRAAGGLVSAGTLLEARDATAPLEKPVRRIADALEKLAEGAGLNPVDAHAAAVVCSACEGAGEVHVSTSVPGDEGWVPCPVCDGKGTRPTDAEIASLREALQEANGDNQALTAQVEELRTYAAESPPLAHDCHKCGHQSRLAADHCPNCGAARRAEPPPPTPEPGDSDAFDRTGPVYKAVADRHADNVKGPGSTKCLHCGGTGSLDDHAAGTRSCPLCHGTGYAPTPVPDYVNAEGKPDRGDEPVQPCKTCRGTGHVPAGPGMGDEVDVTACTDCDGTGRSNAG